MKVKKIDKKLIKINKEGTQLAINFNKLKNKLCLKYSPIPLNNTINYLKNMFNYHENVDKYYNKFNLTKNQKLLI